ncbi:hypothetical protein Alches_05460 [Alicyclobacillus hesperidum subsp. aegles]|nr:hypothetical protein Alches_05460 [Alicyclobacillus hesperidum subsp. aegles]
MCVFVDYTHLSVGVVRVKVDSCCYRVCNRIAQFINRTNNKYDGDIWLKVVKVLNSVTQTPKRIAQHVSGCIKDGVTSEIIG